MKELFSKRHREAIKQKKLPISFSRNLRMTIVRILDQHSDWGGWDNQENFTFDQTEETLKTFWGTEEILAFNDLGERTTASFKGLIRSGYPSEVIDAI